MLMVLLQSDRRRRSLEREATLRTDLRETTQVRGTSARHVIDRSSFGATSSARLPKRRGRGRDRHISTAISSALLKANPRGAAGSATRHCAYQVNGASALTSSPRIVSDPPPGAPLVPPSGTEKSVHGKFRSSQSVPPKSGCVPLASPTKTKQFAPPSPSAIVADHGPMAGPSLPVKCGTKPPLPARPVPYSVKRTRLATTSIDRIAEPGASPVVLPSRLTELPVAQIRIFPSAAGASKSNDQL